MVSIGSNAPAGNLSELVDISSQSDRLPDRYEPATVVVRGDQNQGGTAVSDHILNDTETIPIAGWLGSAREMMRPDVMRDMAGAGFNISISWGDEENLFRALDIAIEAGIRLISRTEGLDLGRKGIDKSRGYTLTPPERERISRIEPYGRLERIA